MLYMKDDIIEIKIVSKKHGEFSCLYDRKYHEILSIYRWGILKKDNKYYAVYRKEIRGNKKAIKFIVILMHRLITNAPDGLTVDHIDGNGLNNISSNLRVCSFADNMANKKLYSTNKTGYKGVYLCKKSNKWRAMFRKQGKRYNSSRCSSMDEAAIKYNELALKYSGEFANLNIIKNR